MDENRYTNLVNQQHELYGAIMQSMRVLVRYAYDDKQRVRLAYQVHHYYGRCRRDKYDECRYCCYHEGGPGIHGKSAPTISIISISLSVCSSV
jgi:hypothetical protein